LSRVVTTEAPNDIWPTPTANESDSRTNCGGANGRIGPERPLLAGAVLLSWPTPMVPNGGRQPKGGSMTMSGKTPDGKKRQVDLNYVVRAGLRDPESGSTNGKPQESWPTPRAEERLQYNSQDNYVALSLKVKREAGGKLNPAWVSQLMGYPDGWLEVE
jgi:hypothetical protein